MADIYLDTLFEQKKREFKTQGQGSERFQADFVDAVNRATSRINRDADLATQIAKVTVPSGTVGLDDDYLDVLSVLISQELIKMGQRPARSDEVEYARQEALIPDMIDGIRQDILNKAIDADTSDETDFVGLGALGS